MVARLVFEKVDKTVLKRVVQRVGLSAVRLAAYWAACLVDTTVPSWAVHSAEY